jgi:hypothetical protein
MLSARESRELDITFRHEWGGFIRVEEENEEEEDSRVIRSRQWPFLQRQTVEGVLV